MAVTSYSLAISPCEDVAILEAKPDEMISKKPPTKSGEVSTKFVSPSENPSMMCFHEALRPKELEQFLPCLT
jgi:hypothetical protein